MRYVLRILSLVLCALLLLPLFGGCGFVSGISLAASGEAEIGIVLPAAPSAQVLYARDRFTHFLKNEIGITPAEDTASCKYRLLLGNTGDAKSEELSATLGENTFAMRVMGKDLVVVATNDAFLYDAIARLLQEDGLVKLNRKRTRMRIPSRLDYAGEGDLTSLRYLFTQGDVLKSTATHYMDLASPEGLGTEQGGCFDGTYYYQAFVKRHSASNERDNVVRIGKFDYKTKALVAYSEEMALNHANDITYDAKKGELYVAHNNPNRTRVSVLCAETMELLRSVEIEDRIYGISYCAARDRFAVALSDSQNTRVLEADLSRADDKIFQGTELTARYTTQGICSDDTFIYHVLWDAAYRNKSGFQNVITVYDWYGNFVGRINITIGIIEPENISVGADGRLLVVAAGKNGGALYEICPTGIQ